MQSMIILGCTPVRSRDNETLEKMYLGGFILFAIDWVLVAALWILTVTISSYLKRPDDLEKNQPKAEEEKEDICKECCKEGKCNGPPTRTYGQRVCYLLNCRYSFFDQV